MKKIAHSSSPSPAPRASRPETCPKFHAAIELIGRRWTGVILQQLLAGPARFKALRDGIPGLTDAMLSARLQELEREGIVSRTITDGRPVKVRYALTELGEQLAPVLQAVAAWSTDWAEQRPADGGA